MTHKQKFQKALCTVLAIVSVSSMVTPTSYAAPVNWHKLGNGCWVGIGELPDLQSENVLKEFMTRNEQGKDASVLQARLYDVTCSDKPAYHRALLVFDKVDDTADRGVNKTIGHDAILLGAEGYNDWKIVRPFPVLPEVAGVGENIPVIHVNLRKKLKSVDNPANAEHAAWPELKMVKLEDSSRGIELDMSVTEQANQEKDNPEEFYKNPQMIAEVIKANEKKSSTGAHQVRLFKLCCEDDTSYCKYLLATINSGAAAVDDVIKKEWRRLHRDKGYHYRKIAPPAATLPSAPGDTEGVPVIRVNFYKKAESADNGANEEDYTELELKWIQLADGSWAVDIDKSVDAEN
ncbi:hypothetical protein FACS1894198_0570 [Clostridia bacterium]|nr:hypothetical protein FACS1894198_0570 [Clostridia bacterium]